MFLQLGKELRMVSGKPSDIKMRDAIRADTKIEELYLECTISG